MLHGIAPIILAVKHQLKEQKYTVSNIALIVMNSCNIFWFTWRNQDQQEYLVLIIYLTSIKNENFVTVNNSVQPMGNNKHSA